MAFTTKREASASERLAMLVAQKHNRSKNVTTLAEQYEAKKNAVIQTSLLESADLEEKEMSKRTEALESLRIKKLKSDAKSSRVTMENKLYNEGMKILKKKVLFEMVYNSYWLDDDVKAKTVSEMYDKFNATMSYVEENCKESLQESETPFLSNIGEIIESTCRKASKRIAKEAKDSGDVDVSFDLTSDEEKEMDDKLNELGKDEIEQMVRDKVLSVVKDEKANGKKKAEMFDEIDKAEKEEDDDEDENDDIKDDDDEDDKKDKEDDDEDEKTGETESYQYSLESLIRTETKRALNRSNGGTLFESIMMSNANKIRQEVLTEGMNIPMEEQMNATLIESVLEYTILELLETTGIYNFTRRDITNLKQNLVSSITESSNPGQKKVRINTKKMKTNKDKKVLSANTPDNTPSSSDN